MYALTVLTYTLNLYNTLSSSDVALVNKGGGEEPKIETAPAGNYNIKYILKMQSNQSHTSGDLRPK